MISWHPLLLVTRCIFVTHLSHGDETKGTETFAMLANASLEQEQHSNWFSSLKLGRELSTHQNESHILNSRLLTKLKRKIYKPTKFAPFDRHGPLSRKILKNKELRFFWKAGPMSTPIYMCEVDLYKKRSVQSQTMSENKMITLRVHAPTNTKWEIFRK